MVLVLFKKSLNKKEAVVFICCGDSGKKKEVIQKDAIVDDVQSQMNDSKNGKNAYGGNQFFPQWTRTTRKYGIHGIQYHDETDEPEGEDRVDKCRCQKYLEAEDIDDPLGNTVMNGIEEPRYLEAQEKGKERKEIERINPHDSFFIEMENLLSVPESLVVFVDGIPGYKRKASQRDELEYLEDRIIRNYRCRKEILHVNENHKKDCKGP